MKVLKTLIGPLKRLRKSSASDVSENAAAILVDRADLARDCGKFAEAAELYGAALAIEPTNVPIHVQCGHMNKEIGRLKQAEAHYNVAKAAMPDDADLNLQLGHFYKVAGRLDAAAAAYNRAVILSPGWSEPIAELSWLAERTGPAQIHVPFGEDKALEESGIHSNSHSESEKSASTIRLVSPGDWVVVGAQPIIEIKGDVPGRLLVEFFKKEDFFATSGSAPAVASGITEYDPAADLHRCACTERLEFGLYVIQVRDGARTLLCESGISVYAYDTHHYTDWVERDLARLAEERPFLIEHIAQMLYKPIFLILIETHTRDSLSKTILSIENQIYPRWQVHLIHSEAWTDTKHMPGSDFIIPIRAGDIFSPEALYEFANSLNMTDDLDMIYADEDRLLANDTRGAPFHKPDWSPDYLETFNYIGYPACFRTSFAKQCFSRDGYYGFTLRYSEKTDRIAHIRKVLCHRTHKSLNRTALEEGLEARALSARLKRTGRRGVVLPIGNRPLGWEIRGKLRTSPAVSIVIPTAGKVVSCQEHALDLITHCVSSIHTQTTYRNIEIIVVDNNDLGLERKTFLGTLGCTFVTYREPIFNVAKKLNIGVSSATGQFVVLLNDDIEILTPEWIERMLEHFEKPHVGIVGAKLLYPNDQIQHAGVAHIHGNPDHVRRGFSRYDRGYFLSTCGVRNYVGVTGACMMVRRETYLSVSGYTEKLSVSYNDIDFCQKVRAMGLYIVYTPHVELIHFESQSRKPSLEQEEADYYHERWASELTFDPFYNECALSLKPPTFDPVINQRLL